MRSIAFQIGCLYLSPLGPGLSQADTGVHCFSVCFSFPSVHLPSAWETFLASSYLFGSDSCGLLRRLQQNLQLPNYVAFDFSYGQ